MPKAHTGTRGTTVKKVRSGTLQTQKKHSVEKGKLIYGQYSGTVDRGSEGISFPLGTPDVVMPPQSSVIRETFQFSALLPKDITHEEVWTVHPAPFLGAQARPRDDVRGYEIFRMPSEDDASRIADFIQHFDVQRHPAWKTLTKEYPGASLFVIECSADSVEIKSDGGFSTRAQLLIDVPVKYPDGFVTEGSITVPTFVTGILTNDGGVVIDELRLGLNHSAKATKPEQEIATPVSEESKASNPGLGNLSARETEVLDCLMAGSSNKAIARKLDMSQETVKVLIKAILRKLRVANRTQAVIWAAEHLPLRSKDSVHD